MNGLWQSDLRISIRRGRQPGSEAVYEGAYRLKNGDYMVGFTGHNIKDLVKPLSDHFIIDDIDTLSTVPMPIVYAEYSVSPVSVDELRELRDYLEQYRESKKGI